MNRHTHESVRRLIPARLQERLQSLGLGVAGLGPDGQIHVLGPVAEPLRLLVLGREFAVALAEQAHVLGSMSSAAQVVELMPGLFVAPLPPAGRRVRLARHAAVIAPVVLLPTPALTRQPALHRACAAAGRDAETLLREASSEAWIDPHLVPRLAAAVAALHEDAVEVDRHLDETQQLSEQLANCYEELSLLYKLSSHMTVNQPSDQFFERACRELRRVVDLRWMALLLVDTPGRLSPTLTGRFFAEGQLQDQSRRLRALGSALIAAEPDGRWPRIIENTRETELPAADLARQLLVVPLHRDDKLLGVLFGGDKNDGGGVTSVDAKLCAALAASLGIFLENLTLYDGAQDMFMGTLHALTSAIDAKDSYTHGHSQRVALMASQLALAVGLETPVAERVHLAGLVHDVGKIGVPENILTKPGKLTVAEFELIKQHPEIGARILEGVGPMQDLLPGVKFHHERWDGRGYPYGMRGEEIPLFGRLLGIADAFDAMSSNRSYRPSMPHHEVLAEIRDCAATQFDPHLAAAFVELDFGPYFDLIQRHQASDLRRSA